MDFGFSFWFPRKSHKQKVHSKTDTESLWAQAVRVHTDDQDVILLQVWGSKKWRLYNAPTHLPYTEAR